MASEGIERLLQVMAALRDPLAGCPWDLQQDFSTIAPYTIEEAYEVADAIARHDLEELRDELGDLLFQVVFHARLAEEQGAFSFTDVTAAIVEKMIRRHPHVFADAEVADAEAQTRAWEAQKAQERRDKGQHGSLLDGVTLGLPALSRAEKLQKRAARAGFDWQQIAPVFDKVDEEMDELRDALGRGEQQAIEEEMGDLLFACVNLARHAGVAPEQALTAANRKFETRFRAMEQELEASGMTLEQSDAQSLERLWEAVKRRESNGGK